MDVINNVLRDVDIFTIDVDAWSGTKVIDRGELLKAGAKLPPKLLASGGTKNVFDPQDLTKFNTFRRQGDRALEAVGVKVPLLGAYAVPKTAADALERDLKAVKKRFYDYLDGEFFAHFEEKKRRWIAKWPEHEDFIVSSLDSADVIRSKFKFAIGRFQLTSANLVGDTDIVHEVNKVSDRLLDEIASDANDLFKVLEGRMTERTVQRRSLNRMERIRRKLFGFGFLDHAVIPMVDAIDRFVRTLPMEGMVAPEQFMEALALTLILCDPDKVRRHGFGAVTVEDELEALGVATPAPSRSAWPTGPAAVTTTPNGNTPGEPDLFDRSKDEEDGVSEDPVPSHDGRSQPETVPQPITEEQPDLRPEPDGASTSDVPPSTPEEAMGENVEPVPTDTTPAPNEPEPQTDGPRADTQPPAAPESTPGSTPDVDEPPTDPEPPRPSYRRYRF